MGGNPGFNLGKFKVPKNPMVPDPPNKEGKGQIPKWGVKKKNPQRNCGTKGNIGSKFVQPVELTVSSGGIIRNNN